MSGAFNIDMLINSYMPEFWIVFFIIINLCCSLFLDIKWYKYSKWLALVAIVFSMVSTFYLQIEPDSYAFDGAFLNNIYTVFFKILILVCGFFLTLLSRNMIREKKDRAFEYFSVFLSGLLFAMCSVSAQDFVSLFVSLEALGLCCYMLFVFNKSTDSKQLTFGYLVQSVVVSSFFLMGVSMIYGICAKIGFAEIATYLAETDLALQPQLLLTLSLILVATTFLFKLGVVPFSSWLSDTFYGANSPICAFMSSIPVLACFGVLPRILMIFMNNTYTVKIVLALLAVLTIILGALSSIRQDNIKRLMAYSMSVQSGIMLLGLCVFSVYSLSAVLFYLFCYIFANIGAWSAIVLLYDSAKLKNVSDLKGLLHHRPYFVMAFTVILIALAGLAPTCGFVAKLYIFSAVARSGVMFLPILLISMLASIILVYSYWRIIRRMFGRKESDVTIDTNIISSKFILYACSVATVFVAIFSDRIIRLCQLVAYYM